MAEQSAEGITAYLRLLPLNPSIQGTDQQTCPPENAKKMPANIHSEQPRTGNRVGTSSHWNQYIFSWRPVRKTASKAAGLQHGPCSPEKPRNILSSWKLRSPTERHIYNCFHLGENPMNAALLKEKWLPGESMRLLPKVVKQTLDCHLCPMLQKGPSPHLGAEEGS